MNYKINNDHLTTEQKLITHSLENQAKAIARTHAEEIEKFFESVLDDLGKTSKQMMNECYWVGKVAKGRTLIHEASGHQLLYLGPVKTDLKDNVGTISQEALKLYTKEIIEHVKQND